MPPAYSLPPPALLPITCAIAAPRPRVQSLSTGLGQSWWRSGSSSLLLLVVLSGLSSGGDCGAEGRQARMFATSDKSRRTALKNKRLAAVKQLKVAQEAVKALKHTSDREARAVRRRATAPQVEQANGEGTPDSSPESVRPLAAHKFRIPTINSVYMALKFRGPRLETQDFTGGRRRRGLRCQS